MINEKEETIWFQKYRPTVLENYIGNEQLKTKLARYIATGDIPHILLSGPPGTGKTTAAKLIVRNIDCDYKYINASDENSIDSIRRNVKTFASMGSMKPLKVVILDEADYITIQAQMALRNLMEATSKITRFILTCNYVERIDDSIISRTQQFHVVPPSLKEVCIHVAGILTKENVQFKLADIKLVADAFYPDIRKIINELQSNTVDGQLKVEFEKIVSNDFKLQIIEALVAKNDAKKKFQVIRQIVADSEIRDFSGTYRLLYDRVDEYAPGHISEVIEAVGKGQYEDSHVVDKEINFMCAIINILRII